jgi:SNF2 family DNA or RNA helicase
MESRKKPFLSHPAIIGRTYEYKPQDLLLLFLGLKIEHARAVPPDAWDYLTVRDLRNLSLVSSEIRQQLLEQQVEYTQCRDGRDYLVQFPGFPGVLSTLQDSQRHAGLFPHQLASLQAMHRAENSTSTASTISTANAPNEFGALRGGILGDAPGLGKTITMLALIASTAGVRPISPPEFWDPKGVAEGWKWMRTNPAAKETILRALGPIRSWMRQTKQDTIDTTSRHQDDDDDDDDNVQEDMDIHATFQQVARYVSPPFLQDDRFATLSELHHYVMRSLQPFVPRSILELVRQNLMDIQAGLDKRNRNLLKSAKGRRLVWERRLVPSGATLVIVPDALLEHWFQQIHQHLHLELFADEKENTGTSSSSSSTTTTTRPAVVRGVVYLDGVGDLADVVEGGKVLRNLSLNHVPVLQPWELSKHLMVITTFSRCQSEFQREVAAGRIATNERKRQWDALFESDVTTSNESPLLQMRWLRIVVDEGHELGASTTAAAGAKQHGVTTFINRLAAERRWVLSGTPTTGDEDDPDFTSHALDQLQRLLFFLRHPIYGISSSPITTTDEEIIKPKNKKKHASAKSVWIKQVKAPFLAKAPDGRIQLLRVLKEIMVMHRKEDIQLPRPIFNQVERDAVIPMDIQKELQQNASGRPLELLSGLDQYLHSAEFQSLVDHAQAEYILEAIKKARQELAKRGGPLQNNTQILQPIADYRHQPKNAKDLRPIKAVVYSSDHNILLSVADGLIRMLSPEALSRENVAEIYEATDIGDMSAELARFRHDMKECRTCPICERENDVRLKGRVGDRCTATLLEVVSTSTTPQMRFLVEPERVTQAFNVPLERMQEFSLSDYNKNSKFWRVGDLIQVDVRDPHPFLPKRQSEAYWDSVGADQCRQRAAKVQHQGQDWYFGSLPTDQEFMEVMLVKWQDCGRYHNRSRWYDGPRLADVSVQKIKEDVFLLSLDAGLSHGLDLSFVTHMFLLEPISDAALLEQVTSRAHRLGATGPVVVETIHVFYKLSEQMDKVIQVAAATNDGQTDELIQDRNKALSKIHCHYCYRQFDSNAKAEEHERTFCPRNPVNETAVDHFHLSSVYRQIRPPPPLSASLNTMATTRGRTTLLVS